jgi:hypothetical protein
LLLAAGKLVGTISTPLAKAEALQEFAGTFLPVMLIHPGIDRRYFCILGRGQVRQQVVALKDESEVVTPQPGQVII